MVKLIKKSLLFIIFFSSTMQIMPYQGDSKGHPEAISAQELYKILSENLSKIPIDELSNCLKKFEYVKLINLRAEAFRNQNSDFVSIINIVLQNMLGPCSFY